jgi:carbon storage regulator CsrA
MLVVSRKLNQEIVIGEKIRVKLVKIGGGRARLAISAPRAISVRRAELGPDPRPKSFEVPQS